MLPLEVANSKGEEWFLLLAPVPGCLVVDPSAGVMPSASHHMTAYLVSKSDWHRGILEFVQDLLASRKLSLILDLDDTLVRAVKSKPGSGTNELAGIQQSDVEHSQYYLRTF
jgi:hypothetical protein